MTPLQIDPSPAQEVLKATNLNGLHIVANFTVHDTARLTDSKSFKSFIDLLIGEFHLSKVGEIYHDFDNGGFTGVVCLTESHLSIHTWPEFQYLTFDIFLSNYLKDNRATTHALYNAVKVYFNAEVSFEQIINR